MGLAANKVYCVNANYSAVPTQLNYKKITLMVNVGNCSSVAVTADGASVPATYISSSGTALFTTTGSSINVTAVNWTSGGTGAATKATLYNNYHWAYSLTFDDNRQSQFDNGVTLLQQHGWRAAEAVVATWANSGGPGQYFMNWAELQTLRNTYGWDMMNHSNDHPNPLTCNGTATDIVPEVTQNQTALLSKFPGYYVNQMVFPYENSTANTCAGYPTTFLLSAECGGGSYNYVDTALPFQFQRGGMFGTDDTAWKSLADSAATNSRPTWLVEYTHSIAAGSGAAADAYSTNQATLGDLLNHLDSTYGATGNKSMWFAPAPEVRDYLFVRDNAVVTTCTAATPTPTSTPAVTLTPTATATATRTASMTPTPTNTATSTSTASRTNTSTATPSSTATRTPVPPTATLTPTGTLSSTPSSSPTGTPTTTRSMTPTPTFTPTDSTTATPTSSPTLTATPSASPSSTLTPTNTFVNSPTPTNTTTNTLTATRSSTPTGTATPTSTETPTWTTTSTSSATMTNTLINSPTPTQTATTPTRTSTVTATNTSRATASSTPTAALSWTKTFTSTSTVAVTSTETPTFTLTLTPTKTLSITPTAAGNTGVVLFPNPVTGPTVGILPPASDGPENVRIEIFTLSFRRVLDETSSNLPSGKTVTVQLDDRWGRSLADGIYYVVVSADGRRSIAKLMILR